MKTVQGKKPAVTSMFIKLWPDIGLSALNHYLLLWSIESDAFQLPQLHKHFNFSYHRKLILQPNIPTFQNNDKRHHHID